PPMSALSRLFLGLALLVAAPAFAQMDDAPPNLVEVVVSTDQLSTLETAVKEAGLVEALSGEGPFTVFAPTNDAFAGLPDGTLDQALANTDVLTGILTHHVVAGAYTAADLRDGMRLETLAGGALPVTITDDGTVMVGEATVAMADVQASNGVAHVIDKVLLAPVDVEHDGDADHAPSSGY
ncbi:MAG: fasciclin domain-containing protein, partial [Rhodothermales bacterium]|nr:fasciclin domain-containing protein [Rhodothermales bacterium]